MLSIALKAKLPIIGVRTEDIAHFTLLLQSIAGKPAHQYQNLKSVALFDKYVYYTGDASVVTPDLYDRLVKNETCLVVLNPAPNPLIFDSGALEVPHQFIDDLLSEVVSEDKVQALRQSLLGMSLKGAYEVIRLTMASTGALTPAGLRKMRMRLGGSTVGLQSVDTAYTFYHWPTALVTYLKENALYFSHEDTPQPLIPRGVALTGAPGVGKSMAAKVIAAQWQLPLFRMDLGASLSRWMGESERKVADLLAQAERNSPCVLLIDEVEKLFGELNDSGTTSRILGQLLWWMQEHRSRIFIVMTTNNINAIPPELYRPGRIDTVITVPLLDVPNAKSFAVEEYRSIMGAAPNQEHFMALMKAINDMHKSHFAHRAVAGVVHDTIKREKWLLKTTAAVENNS